MFYLSVKDPLVCADDVLITEEKVEVLEGLRQEEGLLNIVLVSPNLETGDILRKLIQNRSREGRERTWYRWTFQACNAKLLNKESPKL